MHIFCTEKNRQKRKRISDYIVMERLYYICSKSKVKIPLLKVKLAFNKKRVK